MLRRTAFSFLVVAVLTGSPAAFGQSGLSVPSPDLLVQRAWEEAGGLEAYGRLGIVLADFTVDENTQEGKPSTTKSKAWFASPGPTPGRIELEKPAVVSGDEGTSNGGWAIVGGKPDVRQSTQLMIKRLLTSKLFTLMLPFSLNWDGVALTSVEPTTLKGVPAWRLTVKVTNGFFHSPQIATTWRIDFNRQTYAVIQAESSATDMGKGIKADGMRVTWSRHLDLRGVRVPGEQRTVGLSETGAEKAHTRIERLRWELLPQSDAAPLFKNPVPPALRPTPPPLPGGAMQRPTA